MQRAVDILVHFVFIRLKCANFNVFKKWLNIAFPSLDAAFVHFLTIAFLNEKSLLLTSFSCFKFRICINFLSVNSIKRPNHIAQFPAKFSCSIRAIEFNSLPSIFFCSVGLKRFFLVSGESKLKVHVVNKECDRFS